MYINVVNISNVRSNKMLCIFKNLKSIANISIAIRCDFSTLLPIQGLQWISHLSSAHLCFKIQCHLQHWCTFTHCCSRDYCSWSIFSTCPQTAFLFSRGSPSALPGSKYENMIPIIKKSLLGSKYENLIPNMKKFCAWFQIWKHDPKYEKNLCLISNMKTRSQI